MPFYPSSPAASKSGFLIDGSVAKKDLSIEFFAEEENCHISAPTTFIKAVNYNSQVYLISKNTNRVYRFNGGTFVDDSDIYIPQSPSLACSVFATDDMFVYTNSNDSLTTSFYYQGNITDYKWVKGPDIDYFFQSALAYYKGVFHAFGGGSVDDSNGTAHSTFKIGDSKWIREEDLPFSCWHSITLVNDLLYFLGSTGIWVFDGAEYRSLGELPFEMTTTVSSIAAYDKILCVGTDGTLNIFDTTTETWSQVSDFSKELSTSYSARLFRYNNGIFSLGDSSDIYKVCRYGYKEV